MEPYTKASGFRTLRSVRAVESSSGRMEAAMTASSSMVKLMVEVDSSILKAMFMKENGTTIKYTVTESNKLSKAHATKVFGVTQNKMVMARKTGPTAPHTRANIRTA